MLTSLGARPRPSRRCGGARPGRRSDAGSAAIEAAILFPFVLLLVISSKQRCTTTPRSTARPTANGGVMVGAVQGGSAAEAEARAKIERAGGASLLEGATVTAPSTGTQVTVVPTIIFLLALVILGGRIARANGAVEAAAHEAARAASVSRALAEAETAARTTADVSLSSAGLDCTRVVLSTALAALTAPVGQIGQVSVTVTCTVPLADLGPLGEPDRTITYTAVSSVDPYRSRG